ncbi:MAG: 3-deoxy-manno-octulosonate cytidylyltransferase [Sediminibacterium sp.]|nr:3-deoxy-manno-octulosonate cytidylyltransferase [Sediminibacterium sp.]
MKSTLKMVACIPARYAATRFPAKLMQPLGEHTVIVETYLNTIKTNLFNEVWVITDSAIIYDAIKKVGGKVKMSSLQHESGTDRIAEIIETEEVDIIINVQGDEPFVQKEQLENLIQVFYDNPQVQVASLMQILDNEEEIINPNFVKVAVDKNNNAMYFSRSVIPYNRATLPHNYYEHIGIYAFKKNALLHFYKSAPTPLELAEKIECLRFLEMGIPIKMVLTNYMGIEIDTPEDLINAQKKYKDLKVKI